MNNRATELALQRERLLMRSQQLRAQAVDQAAGLQPAFSVVDRVQDAWFWLRGHPEIVGGAALGLAILRPRRAFRLGLKVWSLWRVAQRWRVVATLLQRYF